MRKHHTNLILAILHALVVLVVCLNTANASTTYEARAAALNRWLDKQSTTPPYIHVAATESMGLGIVVSPAGTQRVRKGVRILELPLNATLCRERPSPYQTILASADEEMLIVLSLMTEHALGPKSLFEPWIEAMPTPAEAQPPWTWPSADRKFIEPLSVAHMVTAIEGRTRGSYRSAMQQWIPQLKAYVEGVHPPRGAAAADFWSYERFAWAKTLVDTRAWNMQGKKYLVPGADFFNHDEDVDDLAYTFHKRSPSRSQKFLDHHLISTSRGRVRVARVLSDRAGGPAGTVLHESYGDNTNDIYMAYHGFLPHSNRRDCQQTFPGRGVAKIDRDRTDKYLMDFIFRERPIGRNNDELWDQLSVCVHPGERPPLLEAMAWLVTLGGTQEQPFRSLVADCIKVSWGSLQPMAQGYVREDHMRRAMRECLIRDPGLVLVPPGRARQVETILKMTEPRSTIRFLNATHRVEHALTMKAAKSEFATLRIDTETLTLESSEDVGYRKQIAMRMRLNRKLILRGLLNEIRASQTNDIAHVSVDPATQEPAAPNEEL